MNFTSFNIYALFVTFAAVVHAHPVALAKDDVSQAVPQMITQKVAQFWVLIHINWPPPAQMTNPVGQILLRKLRKGSLIQIVTLTANLSILAENILVTVPFVTPDGSLMSAARATFRNTLTIWAMIFSIRRLGHIQP
ncbi:hypothetical protein D9757_000612 [Collybiopsis confluens]|uniref:Uncharacterized protein n=1 Tax=Collybiopsis confluens TaxID=2823264 RepID=A0A8H5I1T7_9AGAR|nr:hypothetical protein D9757_000612 [Collybiopsis confluens]